MGAHLGQAPYGINSFVFGIFERSLVPFGLHHAFYAPLWYTSAGGSLDTTLKPLMDGNAIFDMNGTEILT
jgi:PTS system glucose-specific IIC component